MIPLNSKSIVLAVLSVGYATGAEIIRRVKDQVGMSVQVGSIYPAMAMLEEDGLIRIRKRGGRRVRGNVYELSSDGRKQFRVDSDVVRKLYGFDTMEAES